MSPFRATEETNRSECGGVRGIVGIGGEQMVTGERCSNELRGCRRKSFCIEMSLEGEGTHTHFHFLLFVFDTQVNHTS